MPKSADWVIRPIGPDDRDAVRRLFEVVFGSTRSADHDRWKFDRNPAGNAIGAVAVDGDRIVGQYVLLPTRLRLGDEVVNGAQSLDTMVHPDFRGKGLFRKLALASFDLAAARGTEVLYGFPNSNSYRGFVEQLNWDHTGDIDRWVRPIDFSRHPKIPAIVKPVARAAGRLWRGGNISAGGSDVRIGRPTGEDLETVLRPWRERPRLCRVERSAEWYEWRFDPQSQGDYEWIAAYRRGALCATVILKNASGQLADFLGEDQLALEAAIAVAVRRAAARGVSSISTFSNEPPAVAALKACGFVRRAQVPLIVRALTARNFGANIHNHSAWSVNAADFDTV